MRMPKHTHGLTNTRPYQIWYNMKERCDNENCPAYKSYGNRGIKVCQEWSNSFESFLSWAMLNGYQSNLTLDRIDNDKGYEPSNCRWVTQHIQALNRRMSKKNTSGYVGITKVTTKQGKKRWAAQITVNYKSKVLCWRKTQKEALEIRNKYIIDNHLDNPIQEYTGEKANL